VGIVEIFIDMAFGLQLYFWLSNREEAGMRAVRSFFGVMIALALMAALAWGDTLVLKTGESVTGSFDGGTTRVLKFRTSGGAVKEYDIMTVQEILFSDEQKPTALPTPTENKKAADYTFPAGTKMNIRMIDSIGSENQTEGSLFLASLDAPMRNGGVEVIPKGADVWGRVANSDPLGLELTQLFFNGNTYSISAESSKLEMLEIPADTKLEFTLKEPLVVEPR
jgi:hypothetical protein